MNKKISKIVFSSTFIAGAYLATAGVIQQTNKTNTLAPMTQSVSEYKRGNVEMSFTPVLNNIRTNRGFGGYNAIHSSKHSQVATNPTTFTIDVPDYDGIDVETEWTRLKPSSEAEGKEASYDWMTYYQKQYNAVGMFGSVKNRSHWVNKDKNNYQYIGSFVGEGLWAPNTPDKVYTQLDYKYTEKNDDELNITLRPRISYARMKDNVYGTPGQKITKTWTSHSSQLDSHIRNDIYFQINKFVGTPINVWSNTFNWNNVSNINFDGTEKAISKYLFEKKEPIVKYSEIFNLIEDNPALITDNRGTINAVEDGTKITLQRVTQNGSLIDVTDEDYVKGGKHLVTYSADDTNRHVVGSSSEYILIPFLDLKWKIDSHQIYDEDISTKFNFSSFDEKNNLETWNVETNNVSNLTFFKELEHIDDILVDGTSIKDSTGIFNDHSFEYLENNIEQDKVQNYIIDVKLQNWTGLNDYRFDLSFKSKPEFFEVTNEVGENLEKYKLYDDTNEPPYLGYSLNYQPAIVNFENMFNVVHRIEYNDDDSERVAIKSGYVVNLANHDPNGIFKHYIIGEDSFGNKSQIKLLDREYTNRWEYSQYYKNLHNLSSQKGYTEQDLKDYDHEKIRWLENDLKKYENIQNITLNSSNIAMLTEFFYDEEITKYTTYDEIEKDMFKAVKTEFLNAGDLDVSYNDIIINKTSTSNYIKDNVDIKISSTVEGQLIGINDVYDIDFGLEHQDAEGVFENVIYIPPTDSGNDGLIIADYTTTLNDSTHVHLELYKNGSKYEEIVINKDVINERSLFTNLSSGDYTLKLVDDFGNILDEFLLNK